MQTANQGWITRFLKLFFRLLYHQFAWTYDLVAWMVSVGQWNQWVAATLPFLTGSRVLELGHGPGYLQSLARQNNLNIFGLDLSPQMGRICQKRMRKNGHAPQLITGSGVDLPLASASFETVTATFPTEYIIFPETLAQIYRVLTPGGKFVLLPLAWVTGAGPIHQFASWLFRVTGQSVEIDHPALQKGHTLIRQAGFTVETQTIEQKHSKVLVLLARKPE